MAKQKFPTPKTPRAIEDLNKIYSQLVSKLGENSLHLKRINMQNDQIMVEISSIEVEAQERQAIDKQAAEAVAKEEVKP